METRARMGTKARMFAHGGKGARRHTSPETIQREREGRSRANACRRRAMLQGGANDTGCRRLSLYIKLEEKYGRELNVDGEHSRTSGAR